MMEILQARINPTYMAHVMCQFISFNSRQFELLVQNVFSFIHTSLRNKFFDINGFSSRTPLPSPTNNNDEAFLKTCNNSPDRNRKTAKTQNALKK